MFDLSMIHHPGNVSGRLNLGRIFEAMLYYERVHLMINAQTFSGLWDILAPDDFAALLRHPTITATLTPEMLAVQNQAGTIVDTHRPVYIRLSGRDGKMLHPKDDVGSLLELVGNSEARPGATRAKISNITKQAKTSKYAKILGSDKDHNRLIFSMVSDTETLKLFVTGWAKAHNLRLNIPVIENATTMITGSEEEFGILSSASLGDMIYDLGSGINWSHIVNSVQDYAVDLHLSNAYSADIITTSEVAQIASERIDMSIRRATRNVEQISAFEELVFEDAHSFADAVNDGLLTFSEAMKVIDQSRRFREWLNGLAPDANLVTEYHRAITSDTILGKLPASIARFSFFNGVGMLADVNIPGTGIIASAIDTFVVERLTGGWKPNVFVRNVKKQLIKAQRKVEKI